MKVSAIAKNSQAEQEGILPGDEVLSVNGNPVRDDIDFLFHGSEDLLHLAVRRGERVFEAVLDGYGDSGIEFEPMNFISCGNRCVFCFVDQNPSGMRKTIYFKDEDYRLSFLHGAYVTLTRLTDADLERIIGQRLSPLYISVHVTDPEVRRTILGLKRDDRLIEKLDRLIDGGIRLHTQIVVCPGINDGAVLEQSIDDLAGRFPGILSIAVVPVGLTRHRGGLYPLRPVDETHARETISAVDRLQAAFRERNGAGFVYCSDEWYIRAGVDIPAAEYYDDFPQIENGVGMVRDFLEGVDRLETIGGEARYNSRLILVTGVSMSRHIGELAGRLTEIGGVEVRTAVVVNRFYGETVTVSGLLAGNDIIRALEGTSPDETVVLPPNCLNDDGLFIDDLAPDDISRAYGVKVVQGEYDPVATFLKQERETNTWQYQ